MNGELIPRSCGWEEIFEPLIRRITGVHQSDVRAGCEFRNETFEVRPHFLGEYCYCEYGKTKRSFEQKNPHKEDCFHSQLEQINKDSLRVTNIDNRLDGRIFRINKLLDLCNRFSIKYDTRIVNDICTCGVKEKWFKLSIQHDDDCIILRPNFLYIPEDIRIFWHKRFFRDSYINKSISKEDFTRIVNHCISSVSNQGSQVRQS